MNPFDNMTFERALLRLKEIINDLGDEEIQIDDGYYLCQEGQSLIKFCRRKLKIASNLLELYAKQDH